MFIEYDDILDFQQQKLMTPKEAKKILEANISAQLNAFEEETGLSLDKVVINRLYYGEEDSKWNIEMSVTV